MVTGYRETRKCSCQNNYLRGKLAGKQPMSYATCSTRDVEKVTNNVVPLIKVLEAQPVGIPYWAFENDLVVAPAHEMPLKACNDETASTDKVPFIAC